MLFVNSASSTRKPPKLPDLTATHSKLDRATDFIVANKAFSGLLAILLFSLSMIITYGAWLGFHEQTTAKAETHTVVLGESTELGFKPESVVPTKISSNTLAVEFAQRTLIDSTQDPYPLELFTIGRIAEGDYVDQQLLLLKIDGTSGKCAGSTCHHSTYARLIDTPNGLVYLPLISVLPDSLDQSLRRGSSVEIEPKMRVLEEHVLTFLTKQGPLRTNDQLTHPLFSYPKKINSHGVEIELLTNTERDGQIDNALINPVFNDPELGTVYTTKFDKQLKSVLSASKCQGNECFQTNMFYVFRPDGTYLTYSYLPTFSALDIELTTDLLLASEYLPTRRISCDDEQGLMPRLVEDGILKESKMKKVGNVPFSSEPVYALVDFSHKHYQVLFDEFVATQPSVLYGDELLGIRFDEFVRSLPVFYWRDPFGRLVQFVHADYVQPMVCGARVKVETKEEKVITFDFSDELSMIESVPDANAVWSFIAKPNGTLNSLNLSDRYEALEWDGLVGSIARPKVGWVVRREELSRFFDDKLLLYGLTTNEIHSFKETWLPELTHAQYYQIGFYPKEIIDIYAPVSVEPKPDNALRIMMDYRPMSLAEPMVEPILPSIPDRQGVTVVEWSAIKR